MNIDWIIPCRYAEVHDNLATIVGAGIDTWWVPTFPHPIQVGIVVRLLAEAEELGPDSPEHLTRNVLSGPSGQVISDLSGNFQAQMTNARSDWLNGIALITMVQFMAEAEGTYTFEHIVDSSSKAVPLHIVQGTPPGVPPT